MLFKGTGVAMVTPFNDKGIDYSMAERLIEFWIAGGVSALLPLGTTGEASTVSGRDRINYLRFVIEKTAGRVPVIAGTGSNCTDTAIENTAKAETLGADGALIVTPYYNKCTQGGIYAHYRAICAATRLPVIAYNVPSRTGVNILPETALRLTDINGVAGIKEASGNMEQICQTIRLTTGRLEVYSGDDGLAAPAMMMGASGVISVAANVAPRLVSDMTAACLAREFTNGAQMQHKLAPLINSLFCEVNPIPVKAAMSLIGYDCGIPRLPLTEAVQTTVDRLKKDLTDLSLA